jgi:CelD/BcsL family acetyltransferase involved in cellulose biosynthesis
LAAVWREKDRLIGLAPWYVESERGTGKCICFLGSGEVCSDELTVLSRPGHQRQVTAAIAQWLVDGQGRRGRGSHAWNTLKFTSIRHDEPGILELAAELTARGAVVRQRPLCNAWKIELPATWEEYLAILSKDHRKKVRRLERNYIDGGRVRLVRATDEASLAVGFRHLVELHGKRWRTEGRSGVFASQPYFEFHRRVSRQLLQQNRLRLWWIELDGQTVAVEYQFCSADTIFAYQSGFEPTAAHHQPGNLAMIFSIRSAISEGFRQIDLMRGDEPYKAHWRAQPCRLLDVRMAARGWRHRTYCRAWAGVSKLKDWLRSAGL